MVSKLDRVVTYHEGFLQINPHDPLIMGLAISNDNENTISTITVRMAPKRGRMVMYLKQHPPIKLLNSLIMWSC